MLEHKGTQSALTSLSLYALPRHLGTVLTANGVGTAHSELSTSLSNTRQQGLPFIRWTRKWLILSQAQMLYVNGNGWEETVSFKITY